MGTTPTTTRPAATRRAMRAAVERIHTLLGARLLEPTDWRLLEDLEDAIDALWWLAIERSESPHGYCLERYCDCHTGLWLREPAALSL